MWIIDFISEIIRTLSTQLNNLSGGNHFLSVISNLRIAKTPEDVKRVIEQGKHYFEIETDSGIEYYKRETEESTAA